ncbi:hypothetical protein FJW04_10215 [Mesorhizobium sp. B2-7-3]|uniref:hypothetical protein n=1 Tax=Mesorhizobium sp. B2-7-3 TaxID=2589907 RepID=UPI00112D4361|nr:hypothetical protein [Mesorhizobium sp. B2-7-3]TPJ17889.1 hypothetical protein FJW04_10215 [Mesorhizobium sp. B2-7-3]
MTDKLPFLSANDKDIFDLLMSSRGRMSEAVLHSISIGRGIIYSIKTTRERLASDIASLPHDYLSLSKLIERREQQARQEKRTYVDIPAVLTHEEINQIVRSYKSEVAGEEITTQQRRVSNVNVNVTYDEIDYSKTRLIQRQRRDAGIEFVIGDEGTTIRMPSTEKARGIVDKFIQYASKIKLKELRHNEISLQGFSADQRTNFFMQIMQTTPGYQLQTVVNIKCATEDEDVADDFELDIENERSVESDIVSKINSVALSGMNLLQSEEYQTLRRNGFFITAVTWRAMQKEKPQDLLQFDVSFEDPRRGKGFKFGVRIARRLADGSLTNDFKPLEPNRQPALWSLVERTSSGVLKAILSSSGEEATTVLKGART